jgi:CBS domain-containing membrane protein
MPEPRQHPGAVPDRLRPWLPAQPPARLGERLIAAAAGFAGILALAAGSAHFLGTGAMPFLVASMGASAVLLFAVPHSPLAHPWSFAGGHLVSALTGVLCAKLVPDLFAASALAVGTAIFLMHSLRCLHPPGGASALIPVLGGEAVRAAGFGVVLAPIGLNVLVMLIAALIINNVLPGRRWPLRPRHAPRTAAPGWPLGRLGLTREDLDVALREMNALIDVDQSDLEQIYAKATMHARQRRLGEVRCADIMSREVVSAEFGDELGELWSRMHERKVKGVPIIDRSRRVIGIVTIMDFMKQVGSYQPESLVARLHAVIRRTPGLYADKPEVAGQIMSRPAITARDDAHIVTLVPLFAEYDIHHIPIVDAENRLVGIVTQSDLVGALYRTRDALSSA